MKSLLIMLLVSICAIAWRSEDIVTVLGAAPPPAGTATPAAAPVAPAAPPAHKAMTIAEFQKLSKTDPQAYRKLVASLQVQEERGAIDKLLNYLAHGEYE